MKAKIGDCIEVVGLTLALAGLFVAVFGTADWALGFWRGL